MNILIVLAHPEPRSYNGALSATAERTFRAQQHTVRVSDLYAKGFDARQHARHYRHRTDPTRFFVQTEQRFNSAGKTLPREVRREIDLLL
jgi:NAD(P)H dehydrogenase (quinone)